MTWNGPRYISKGADEIMLLPERHTEYRIPIVPQTPVVIRDSEDVTLTTMRYEIWRCIGKVGEFPDVWGYRLIGIGQ